jgi:signal transduction histidine kinase
MVDFVEGWKRPLRCEPLAQDRSLRADPFWLKFVLSNLVQNAFDHGAEPVIIRLSAKRDKIQIAVEDRGRCEFGSFQEMSDPFVKDARSQGMGLGLNIVRFVVEQWGAAIRFSSAPTSFTLEIG